MRRLFPSECASDLTRPRPGVEKPGRAAGSGDLFSPRSKVARAAADSIHGGCYAICSGEVAAVRIGVGRGARHEIILRSGIRLPVTYAQATHLADKIWDGVWPGDGTAHGNRNTSKSRSRSKGGSAAKKGARI